MKKNLILFIFGILVLATFVSALPGWLGGKAIDSGDGVIPISSGKVSLSEGYPRQVSVSGQEYTIEAVSISDVSATIRVGNSQKEITEGTTKVVGPLNVKVVTANERFLRSSIVIVELSLSGANIEPADPFDTEEDEVGVYPSPFIVDGLADVAVIYPTIEGVSTMALVAAGNIQTNLQNYVDEPLGNLLIPDHEIGDVLTYNLIGVNYGCYNSAMYGILGIDNDCTELVERMDIEEGQFVIESVESYLIHPEGKVTLLVHGYGVSELVAAVDYLINNQVGTNVGIDMLESH